MYDVTDRESFEKISDWMKQITLYTQTDRIGIVLLGNKVDLEPRQVMLQFAGQCSPFRLHPTPIASGQIRAAEQTQPPNKFEASSGKGERSPAACFPP